MSNKINNLIDTATPMALEASGFMLGLIGHRGINRALETDAMQGLLGNETATTFKRFLTPLIVTTIGIVVSDYVSNDSPVKEIANGFAVSGAVNVGMELLFNTNLMCDKGNGMVGRLLGADDDLDYFEGYEEEDDDEPKPQPKADPQPALPVSGPSYRLPAGKATAKVIEPSMIAGTTPIIK